MDTLLDNSYALRRIFDAIPMLVFIVDSDVRVHHLNSAATDRLGVSKEYVYKKRGGEVLHCIHATEVEEGCGWSEACPHCVVRNSVKQALDGKSVQRQYTRMELQKNGGTTEVHLLISTAPFSHEGGDYAILTIEDVTDLKELKVINRELTEEIEHREAVEKELSAEKELLRTVFRRIGDGVIAVDGKGKVVLMNESAEHFTGWSQKDAMEKSLTDVLKLCEGKSRTPYKDPRTIIREGGLEDSLRYALLTSRTGTERAVTASGASIFDDKGGGTGMLIALHDVTDRLKLETETVRAKAFQSVGVLADGIAHDFNNLLGVIMAALSLAKQSLAPEKKIKYPASAELLRQHEELFECISTAEKTGMNARDLVYELLRVAKVGEPVKRRVSLAELVRESTCLTITSPKWQCEVSATDGLWPVEVDAGQISRVFNNLVENAVESMPDGGSIAIKAENVFITPKDKLPAKEGRYVKVTLKDDGPGIPGEYLDRIFDPYFTTKKKSTARGTGLGLAICYSIVSKHGGHITVESKPGNGAAFLVYLPAFDRRLKKREENGRAAPGSKRI